MLQPATIDDPYGLLDPNLFDDPYPTYHILRHADPVHWWAPIGCWVLTRYRDVYSALSNPAFASGGRRAEATRHMPDHMRHRMTAIDDFIAHWLMNVDAPEHTRRRVPLNRLFAKPVVDGLRARITAIAEHLVDGMLAAGGGDLIEDFAQPLPVAVIAGMVGIPAADHARLFGWFARMTSYFEIGPARPAVLEGMTTTIGEMNDYFDSILERRRRDPGDDIATRLAALEDSDDPAARERTRATLALLLFAGHESTRATFGNGLLALLTHPAALARLRADADLLERAIEEMLRYDGPFMRLDRIATAAADIGGNSIACGDRVMLIVGAANRDPSRFPMPDVFDIGRNDPDHLSFGHGEHFCLGARLARMELRLGFEVLLNRLPRPHIVEPGIVWRRHFNHRGLRSMPLVFR